MSGASQNSRCAATSRPATVPVGVAWIRRLDRDAPVFNLQVAGPHEYFANGVLVSNCTRYLMNTLPDPLPLPAPPVPLTAVLLAKRHLERVIKRGRRRQQGIGSLGREV